MRISDWSSDVCSSDLLLRSAGGPPDLRLRDLLHEREGAELPRQQRRLGDRHGAERSGGRRGRRRVADDHLGQGQYPGVLLSSEEHTSELQSLMRSSYAVFCLKKKTY